METQERRGMRQKGDRRAWIGYHKDRGEECRADRGDESMDIGRGEERSQGRVEH
jgi:hypothetical protein